MYNGPPGQKRRPVTIADVVFAIVALLVVSVIGWGCGQAYKQDVLDARKTVNHE